LGVDSMVVHAIWLRVVPYGRCGCSEREQPSARGRRRTGRFWREIYSIRIFISVLRYVLPIPP